MKERILRVYVALAIAVCLVPHAFGQYKTGAVQLLENGACSAGVANSSYLCADSTTHALKVSNNAGSFLYPMGLTSPQYVAVARVAGDFTTAANTALQTITGLTFTLPANTAANYPLRCEILYSQATAAVADQFGIQAATFNPTNIMAKGDVATSASATTFGNVPTLATTTATAIVTFTPSAITTVWNARLTAMIENPSNASTQTVNVMVQTSNSADLVTVKRGSYCVIGF
jgi:hypothetical protein